MSAPRRYLGRVRRVATVRLRAWLDEAAAFEGLATVPGLAAKLDSVTVDVRTLRTQLDALHAEITSHRDELARLAQLVETEWSEQRGDGTIAIVQTELGPMLLPGWDEVLLPVLRRGEPWEREEADWLVANIRPGATVAVVGAHVGYHVLRISRLVGSEGRVLALEPDQSNFSLLRANLFLNAVENVEPICAAAGSGRAVGQLVRSANNPGDHRLFRHPDLPVRDTIAVPVVALDDILDSVDVIVTDAQGYDHRVIAGAKRLVREHRPSILTEFWTQGLEGLGDDPRVVIQQYRDLGYAIAVLGCPRLGWNPSTTDIIAAADAEPGRYVTLILAPPTTAEPRI